MILLQDGTLATANADYTIKIWCIYKSNFYSLPSLHDNPISHLCELSDGRIASSDENTIKIWNVKRRCCLRTLSNCGIINSIISLRNGNIVSAGQFIAVHNPHTGKIIDKMAHNRIVHTIAMMHDGDIIGAGEDDYMRIWNVRSMLCTRLISVGSIDFTCMVVLYDGMIACGGGDGVIRVWKPSGVFFKSIRVSQQSIDIIVDLGEGIVACVDKTSVEIWDINISRCKQVLSVLLPVTSVVPLQQLEIKSNNRT
jgi:WD40 repeat protein